MHEEDENEWQAECDARTLAEAECIRMDEDRLSKAQEAAKHLAEEEHEHAEAMARAGRGMIEYSKSPDPPKKG
jgi:hypothetical protein